MPTSSFPEAVLTKFILCDKLLLFSIFDTPLFCDPLPLYKFLKAVHGWSLSNCLVPYLFLPGGCVDRVHTLRQITAVFHSGVAAGVDAVGHVAGAVADAPLAAVDCRGCDDAGGADGCNLLTGLLTGLRSYCSCLGCLDLSLGLLVSCG